MKPLLLHLVQSLLGGLGLVWLFLEPYYALTNVDPAGRIGFVGFLVAGGVLGAACLTVDGFYLTGFLKRSIEITSNAFDTPVKVMFGDVFEQAGWKAISVNEFFDSAVDGKHVSDKSLHGSMLKTYWGGDTRDWDKQVAEELKGTPSDKIPDRPPPGKPDRYPIGTTVKASINGQDFLCVALTRTDTENLQSSASSDDLHKALRAVLCKARSVCSGSALSIPLLGSGLARTGIKSNIIVDLILLAVFEESKKRKVTSEIRIVLPKNMRKIIDLATIQKDWR